MAKENTHIYAFGPFRFDAQERLLFRDNQPVPLTPKVADTLHVLLQNAGHLVDKDELMRRIWPDASVEEGNLNKNVFVLRKALAELESGLAYIETVPKRGYRFVASVKPLPVPLENTETQSMQVVAPAVRSATRFRALAIGLLALACIVALAALVGRRPWKGVPENSVHSIAVLPLENLSADPSQDYFADGMTDELITDLGQIGSLRVISRISIMKYKGLRKALPQIARELNVDVVVEGTVRRSANQVRISAQLIDARADRHLWAQSYEGDLGNVLGLQSEVASSIAGHIKARLTRQEQPTTKNRSFLSPEAQDAFLRGHYFAEKGTIEDLQKAVSYFNEAIQRDSTQGSVYAGLASAYVNLGHILFLSPQQAFPPAKAAALKALALDGSSDEAHTALGNVKFLYDWDFAGAEQEFQLALQLNPNSVSAQSSYSGFLNAMGRSEDALARVQEVLRIDPLSLAAITDLAWQLYWARRYDDAIAQVRKVAEIDPDYYPAHVCLGLAYEQKHEYSLSIAELKKATGFCRDKCFGLIGQVSALSGDRAGAFEALRQLQRRPYVSPWLVAIVYAELGDKDRAFLWLEKAYQGREHDLAFSNVWPMFDSLHQDPRFKDLVRRIGLKQPLE